MTERKRKNTTGRTIALAAGGGLVLWLLLRREGWKLGARGADRHDSRTISGPTRGAPCRVRIDAPGIQIDGAPVDLPDAVARCQAVGSAEITATGAAITGVVASVMRALQDAGVVVHADPSLWTLAGLARPEAP